MASRYAAMLLTLATLSFCLCAGGQPATGRAIENVVAGSSPPSLPTHLGYVAADTVLATSTQALQSNAIPSWVFKLTQLRQLSIGGMDCDYAGGPPCWAIRELPPEIAQLQQLRTLALPVNSIRQLPAALGQLPHLRSLDLTDNPGLLDITPLVNVLSLEELTLYGCNLTRLPAEIGQLTKLKKLGFIGNPLGPAELARVRKALPHCAVGF